MERQKPEKLFAIEAAVAGFSGFTACIPEGCFSIPIGNDVILADHTPVQRVQVTHSAPLHAPLTRSVRPIQMVYVIDFHISNSAIRYFHPISLCPYRSYTSVLQWIVRVRAFVNRSRFSTIFVFWSGVVNRRPPSDFFMAMNISKILTYDVLFGPWVFSVLPNFRIFGNLDCNQYVEKMGLFIPF